MQPSSPITAIAPAAPNPLAQCMTLIRWNLQAVGPALPLVLIVQAMIGASIIIGIGLMIPNITPETAKFLSSGAPTVMMLTIGFVMVPQGVSAARASGTVDYQRALPVPRLMILLADFTVWVLLAIPGLVVGILTGQFYYGFTFSIDVAVLVVAALLTSAMATSVGYAFAMGTPRMVAMVASQVLAFFSMMFAPINFPAQALPAWLQLVHRWLPFQAAGDLVRAGLLADQYQASARDFAVLAAWTVAGLIITVRVLIKRD